MRSRVEFAERVQRIFASIADRADDVGDKGVTCRCTYLRSTCIFYINEDRKIVDMARGTF